MYRFQRLKLNGVGWFIEKKRDFNFTNANKIRVIKEHNLGRHIFEDVSTLDQRLASQGSYSFAFFARPSVARNLNASVIFRDTCTHHARVESFLGKVDKSETRYFNVQLRKFVTNVRYLVFSPIGSDFLFETSRHWCFPSLSSLRNGFYCRS